MPLQKGASVAIISSIEHARCRRPRCPEQPQDATTGAAHDGQNRNLHKPPQASSSDHPEPTPDPAFIPQ
eukprot:4834167-Pyramimonas_sp.AAC.1